MSNVVFFAPKGVDIEALVASAKQSIETRGGMTDIKISNDVDVSKLPRVGGQLVLAIGTEFALTGKSVQIKARINGQDVDYPALLAVTRDGKAVFIAYNSILQPWLPTSFEEGDRRAEMYSDTTMQKVAAFHTMYNNTNIANSPASGFEFATSIEDRLSKISGAVRVKGLETIKGSFEKDGQAGTLTTRLYAFEKLSDVEAKEFKKDVDKNYAAAAKA